MWLKPISEYPRLGYFWRVRIQPADERAAVDFPGCWDFLRLVLPLLQWERRGGPELLAPVFMHQGLSLLASQTEMTVGALVGAFEFQRRSDLRVWVPIHIWEQADDLRQRFSREALLAGRDEWTTRRVLLCALAAMAIKNRDEWSYQDGAGDYHHLEVRGRHNPPAT